MVKRSASHTATARAQMTLYSHTLALTSAVSFLTVFVIHPLSNWEVRLRSLMGREGSVLKNGCPAFISSIYWTSDKIYLKKRVSLC